ncbi:MAG: class I SAM-dependent RNA methyltransferase [Deltaproteobacteria bacterium]|nr:class I SAM-dependent RNA methyltransferase [Deltaproteobacteria bacterium]
MNQRQENFLLKFDNSPRIFTKYRGDKQRVATYKYQRDSRYFAQIAEGLIEAGAQELAELGAENIAPEFRGIHFRADKSTLYRINYLTRLASRCLAPLISFHCHDTDTLYKKAKQIQWEDFFAEGSTFAVSGNVSDSTISHSKYASLRLKDAVADYFKEKTGKRPDVSIRNPDILLNLHIRHDKAEISLDTSGGALHRRGYREETVSAPMQETVAAAIIRFTGWCNIPSGIFRNKFGFEFLPDFDGSIWKQVKKEADTSIRELPQGLIAGSDLSEKAVDAARINIMGLNYGKNVRVERADFRDLPAIEGRVIVANPPYGIRMGGDDDLEAFYKDFGDFLKQKCKGSTAYIYFGERRYIKKIGLKASWKKPIKAGGLDGRLVKYEMY